jgi:aspartate aminotransferase-like enzyme
MRKSHILAPGPTPVLTEALAAMSSPIIHHRSPEFTPILKDVREGLKWLFQTKNEVLFFASSGTGAMEGAVTNLLSHGDKALVVEGGKFGERWTEICQAYGVEPVVIKVTWGEAVEPALVEKALKGDSSIKAVFTQATETSTGVMYPIKEIAEIVNRHEDTLMIVDAISALGVYNIPTDEWKLDVVVSGSQKALMLPPGLAFASVSEKAWGFAERANLPKYYFNFRKELKSITESNQSVYTPAVSLLIGLRESLRIMQGEGLDNIFARHDALARATRAGVVAMGLELFAPKSPSNSLTAVKAPPGIDGQEVVKTLREKFGITIAGGQSQAKGKIFRIAHLGYFDRFDIITALSALEMSLNELGFKVERGRGVKAAEEILEGMS